MQAGDVAEPAVDDRDVVIDVRAAGVTMLNAKIRDGDFKLILPRPDRSARQAEDVWPNSAFVPRKASRPPQTLPC